MQGAASGANLDDHEHDHADGRAISLWRPYLPAVFSLLALSVGIALDSCFKLAVFNGYLRFAWYLAAYLPVGYPVLKQALIAFRKGEYFTEFLLMGLATIGAFGIGEYPEAVAVMLFYTVGELFESAAVNRAKGSIKALLEVRPTVAHVRRSVFEDVNPESVSIGDTIQIKAGEKVPLDGLLLSARSSFNVAALTGES